jgi:hypothetical protein
MFHIKGGSGHFSVKGSDTSIGTVEYNGKRDIVVFIFTVIALLGDDGDCDDDGDNGDYDCDNGGGGGGDDGDNDDDDDG